MGRGRRLTEDSRVTERLLLMPNSFEVCPSTSQLAPLRQLIHRGYIRPNSPIAACNNIVIYLSRSKIHENFCQAFFNISPRSPLEPPYRAPVRFIRKQASKGHRHDILPRDQNSTRHDNVANAIEQAYFINGQIYKVARIPRRRKVALP